MRRSCICYLPIWNIWETCAIITRTGAWCIYLLFALSCMVHFLPSRSVRDALMGALYNSLSVFFNRLCPVNCLAICLTTLTVWMFVGVVRYIHMRVPKYCVIYAGWFGCVLLVIRKVCAWCFFRRAWGEKCVAARCLTFMTRVNY